MPFPRLRRMPARSRAQASNAGGSGIGIVIVGAQKNDSPAVTQAPTCVLYSILSHLSSWYCIVLPCSLLTTLLLFTSPHCPFAQGLKLQHAGGAECTNFFQTRHQISAKQSTSLSKGRTDRLACTTKRREETVGLEGFQSTLSAMTFHLSSRDDLVGRQQKSDGATEWCRVKERVGHDNTRFGKRHDSSQELDNPARFDDTVA